MNILKVLLAVVFFMIFAIQSGVSEPSDSAIISSEIEKWLDQWVESWNTYDLNKVDELFLHDDRLTYFSSEKEGALIGFDAVLEHHRGFGFVPGGKDQPNKLWVEDLYLAHFDSSVVVTGIWYFERPEGPKQRGPVTIVYVRKGDHIRIAHMNFSEYKDEKKEKKERIS
jgi:hypothetical protein